MKQNAIAGSSSAHPLSVDNDISDTAPSVAERDADNLHRLMWNRKKGCP